MELERKFRRNLFELENARNMTINELADTFVDTESFWRLLTPKNHVVLGSRGSGKTALARMLSHDHLKILKEERAVSIIESRSFIGMYMTTSIEWVGSLKRSWHTDEDAMHFFQWRLNVTASQAFLNSITSCLHTYYPNVYERALLERKLTEELSKSWEIAVEHLTLTSLSESLVQLERKRFLSLARDRAYPQPTQSEAQIVTAMDTDLLRPVRSGIEIAAQVMSFPGDTTWLLCIDEAEYLAVSHHQLINTCLRAYSKNLFIKLITMPYHHHTLDTNFDGITLDVGHDFDYIYVDHNVEAKTSSNDMTRRFADELFRKRAIVSGDGLSDLTLDTLLGPSILIDRKYSIWSANAKEFDLLRKHCSSVTEARAMKLYQKSPTKFGNEISRKLTGALLLRDAVARTRGNAELDVYAGAAMVVRCGDANPRRLVRLYNALLIERKQVRKGRSKSPQLPSRLQNRVLTRFGESTLTRTRSEKGCGPELYTFLRVVGSYMNSMLHELPLGTDQITSFFIDDEVMPQTWELIKKAVGLALLFPNVNHNNTDPMPISEGTFHLAYVLAPHFRLLPRRGRAHRLSVIMASEQFYLVNEQQTLQSTFNFAVDGDEQWS